MDSPAPVPPPAPARRRRPLLIAAVAAVVVLAVVAVVAARVWSHRDSPRAAVGSYLADARAGNTAAMTEDFCAAVREQVLRSGGAVFQGEGLGQLVRGRVLEVRQSGRTAEVTAEVTFAKGGQERTIIRVLVLTEEDGRWRICGGRNA